MNVAGGVVRPGDERFISGFTPPSPPVLEYPRELIIIAPARSGAAATTSTSAVPMPSPATRRAESDRDMAYNAAVFPARPESLEIFRPPSFLEDESQADNEPTTTQVERRVTVRERPGTTANGATKSAQDARVAELARDLLELEASVDRGVDGPARLRVLLEHFGVTREMIVGNLECSVPAFLARAHELLDLDPGYHTMLHYTDADSDMVEITDVQPYTALRDALLLARAKDRVVVSVAQTKREVADAAARAVRRRARADRITQTKRPPSIRPPSTGSSRSSRPDSVVSILAEDVFPVARVAQQLGLEYLDGTRPVNITTAMNSAIAADVDPSMSVATMLGGRRDVQVGNDPRYAEAHAVDRVKGGCCGCHARFRFAIENSEPDETHTAVVRCPMCTTVNLFVVV